MGFQAFDFDESVTQTEAGRPRVPEGYYLLRCDGADPTPEDYEKNTGINFPFTIMEGTAGIGRQIPQFCVLSAGVRDGRGTQFGLGRTLGALGQGAVAKGLAGVKIDSYAKFTQLTAGISARVKGKMAVALIGDQPGINGGRPFSSIVELLPAEDWASLKNVTMQSAVGSPAATNGQSPAVARAPAAPVGSLPDELSALFAGVSA